MEVVYKDKALADIKFWKKSGQITIQNKIVRLIDDILQHLFYGIGKPEALKYELSGLWSVRLKKAIGLFMRFPTNSFKLFQCEAITYTNN